MPETLAHPSALVADTIGVYVHVPFCVRRCVYCAFYSVAGAAPQTLADFPGRVLTELSLRAPQWQGVRAGTVFFGGGTPSLLDPADIARLLAALQVEFPFVPGAEITLEANPGTVTLDSLQGYLQAGINRLSLGVQALDDERLRFLGRVHDCAQAREALDLARRAGFDRISVDLIVGSPGETAAGWDREFDLLLPLRPEGVSFYGLTVEEGTQLARRAGMGEAVHLSPDETVDLLLHAAGRLRQAGYHHYEVSNWALPGAESRHNQHYWRRGSYLGLGPSAHSFNGRVRRWNLPDLAAYTQALEAGKLPPGESETLSDEEIRTEWVYLALRQASGLNFGQYAELFGPAPPYWKAMFESLAGRGMGEFDGRAFRPNDHGLLLADEIAARLLA
ncbi:MAG: radical SAM family heme chaperone HemW [Candidatus Zixiibacteriota bacterium]|nr:MAG: radical SAM family heme chaperone HemW [candidate division Zixibacteria bacterium]